MTDTSLILYNPKNKSSAEKLLSADIYSISYDNDNICSQCGHDHSYKPTGGSAILDMISFLDRDTPSEEYERL